MDQALGVLDSLYAIKVSIFGGDVYRQENGELVFDYGGWYSEPQPGESSDAFLDRSFRETREYISSYPLGGRYFVIVPRIGD